MVNIKIYMVYSPDDSLEDRNRYVFVNAKTEDEAWEKAVINHLINDEYAKEYIYSSCVNEGFAESFFKDEKGYLFQELIGEVRGDIKSKFQGNEKLIKNYIQEKFKDNVICFFEKNIKFADQYIDYILNRKKLEFPKDMLIYAIKKEYRQFYKIDLIKIIE